ncbi:hypothetical protein IW261DRAFT_1514151, partial [Armillaria novae-zelandiae]
MFRLPSLHGLLTTIWRIPCLSEWTQTLWDGLEIVMHPHFTDSIAFYSFLYHSANLRQMSYFVTPTIKNDRPALSANFDASCRPHITGLSLRKIKRIAEMVLSPTLSLPNLDYVSLTCSWRKITTLVWQDVSL